MTDVSKLFEETRLQTFQKIESVRQKQIPIRNKNKTAREYLVRNLLLITDIVKWFKFGYDDGEYSSWFSINYNLPIRVGTDGETLIETKLLTVVFNQNDSFEIRHSNRITQRNDGSFWLGSDESREVKFENLQQVLDYLTPYLGEQSAYLESYKPRK